MFGLVDCNNFFASCERVFNPLLRNVPIVVLSNNDGCIVARIPVTLGIAPTRTLAKVASKYGKKYQGYKHVCLIDSEDKRRKALENLEIGDVWGIGRRMRKRLEYYSINTAMDFCSKSESWIRKEFTVIGVRIWKELRGISCIDTDDLPAKKSICTSRSFAEAGISDRKIIEEAIANFTASCSGKLREQRSCCSALTVFAYTSRFRTDVPQCHIQQNVIFPVPTSDSSEIIRAALSGLRENWREGNFAFKKAGVVVWDILPDMAIQTNLFDTIDRGKQAALLKTIDEIKRKNGHNAIKVAIQGDGKKWKMKNEHISKLYTTNLNEIIEVHCH